MKKGQAEVAAGRDPPICQRPDCKTAAAHPKEAASIPIEVSDILLLRLPESAITSAASLPFHSGGSIVNRSEEERQGDQKRNPSKLLFSSFRVGRDVEVQEPQQE